MKSLPQLKLEGHRSKILLRSISEQPHVLPQSQDLFPEPRSQRILFAPTHVSIPEDEDEVVSSCVSGYIHCIVLVQNVVSYYQH